jgi:hypothetical protein
LFREKEGNEHRYGVELHDFLPPPFSNQYCTYSKKLFSFLLIGSRRKIVGEAEILLAVVSRMLFVVSQFRKAGAFMLT